jgi:GDP-4-dehydro-6-deoxy-D-mannose reductase
MRALVVGADGFVGRWLVRHLLERGDSVAAVVGARYQAPIEGVSEVHQLDVRDVAALGAAVAAAEPDAVYYLAAVSHAERREELADAAGIAVVGSVNALIACAALGSPTRFLYVSSAHVYGNADVVPIPESGPVRPHNVYGAAKAAAEAALLALGPAAGVEVVVARPFNHIGPGQRRGFLVPSLAEQVRALPSGGRGVVRVGAPDMVRDFTDVRDVVRAYRLLVERGEAGSIYNVASGNGLSVRQVVDELLAVAGVQANLQVDASIIRDGEPQVLVGDPSRLAALGWRPERSLRQTLADALAAEQQPG